MTIGKSAQQIYYRTKSVIYDDYMFRPIKGRPDDDHISGRNM